MNARAHQPTTPFLWGSFEAFPLDDVFGVLALSRQLVDVRLSDAEREVGAITVKAGHVVEAEDFRTRASGATALKTLIQDPGMTFSATRLPVDQTEMRNAVDIGTLAELLPEAGDGQVGEAPTPAPARGRTEADAAADRQREVPEAQAPSDRSGSEPPADDNGHAGGVFAPGAVAQEPADDSTPDAVVNGYEARAPDTVTAPAPETASVRMRAVDPQGAPAVAKVADEVILRGTLEGTCFEELLEVLQLSPDPLHISFMRDGNVVGTLDLVSQQVCKTAAGSLIGKEAFARLFADPGETFEVRSVEGVEPEDPLGKLSELLVEAQESGAAPSVEQTAPQSERSLFMEGRLADFPLELLTASLNLSRQPIELELRGDGELLHRVQFVSGRIVTAESAGTVAGAPALAAIRKDPGAEFVVYRRRQLDGTEAIAPLRALLSESGQEAARTANWSVDVPARPVRGETEMEDDHHSGIEGRLDGLAASITELQQALEAKTQAPGEVQQVPHALSEFVSATAGFVSVLEKSHKDALQQITDTLRLRHRGMLRTILVLQIVCLTAVGFLAVLLAP